ncbi:MAG: outer membrane beta-barrel protein, partial [Bacteroidaceae bacterium]|nr:outer membrane beta-barrel protein [Bacteroidaceae bacterium]
TLRATENYSESNSKSLSTSNVHLYQIKNNKGADSTYQTNRFNVTPSKNWNYSVQATYSEPIMKATFLQFSYQFQYRYSKSDRATYDFSNLGEDFFNGLTPSYGGWGGYLSRLENPYTAYEDEDLSRYSEYKNYIHDIQVMLRVIRTAYNFNVGVRFVPQTSHFTQDYQGKHTDTTRTVSNITPTMDFRYKFSKTSQLRVNYRGNTEQPSMTQLLDITDNSDPLNVSKGNPGLKPSFTNNLQIFYNNYIQSHQRFIFANFSASTTSNNISNMVTYDETTGGRTTRPENINGNWNTGGNFTYNMAIDTAGYWNVSTYTNLNYTNSVGYFYDNSIKNSVKNTTRTTAVSERLTSGYRNDWFEFELNGGFSYNHSRNLLQNNNNLDTWQFSYGASTNITLPWGTRIASDISMSSRRGYNDASMNTNELIWNAQISQGFLQGNPLTVSLQFYDILNNQSNYSRTIDAYSRSDVQYNSITNFAMLHVIYRMNVFGNKEARANMRANRMGNDDGPGNFGRGRGGNRSGGGNHGGGGFGGGGFGGGPM